MRFFESERLFQLWSYTVSHGVLLFVSAKDDRRRTRCDVMFRNVLHLDCHAAMSGLEIEVDERRFDLRIEAPRLSAIYGPADVQRFWLRSGGDIGSVIAGNVGWIEADIEFDQPSPLLEGMGTWLRDGPPLHGRP